MIRINIAIAGRHYPINVPASEEEIMRKVGKQIDQMIKDYEADFHVRDKQDVLAMCALRIGANLEMWKNTNEEKLENINNRLSQLDGLLE